MEVPEWVINNCFRAPEDLWKGATSAIVVGDTISEQSSGNSGAQFEAASNVYKIDASLLSPLRRLVLRPGRGRGSLAPVCFAQDAVFLRYRSPYGESDSLRFMNGITRYFASEIGAAVLTLTPDDLRDIAEHFNCEKPIREDVEVFDRGSLQVGMLHFSLKRC